MVKQLGRVGRSRLNLALILVVLAIGMALSARFSVQHALEITEARKLDVSPADVYTFASGYALAYFLMVSLPLLMVVSYRGLQGTILTDKVAESLSQCGLQDHQLRARMQEYEDRNSVAAFMLPMFVNLLFLLLCWGMAMFPRGLAGMLDYIEGGMQARVGLALALPMVSQNATLIVWVFLGTYVYSISSIIRRWMQSDLTTNVLWRINVRLAITLVLGMLFVNLFDTGDPSGRGNMAHPAAFAFLIGITPDMFLRWINKQAKRVFRIEGQGAAALFTPPDLQNKIGGMSFGKWIGWPKKV